MLFRIPRQYTLPTDGSVERITCMKNISVAAIALAGLLAFAQPAPRPAFEVASVKPGDPNNSQYSYRLLPGGRYVATNVTLKDLISSAYAVTDPRMSGGPGWLSTDRFTVEAKAAAPLPPWPDSNKVLGLLLQSLLEDRFKLAVHWETRQAPVYELLVEREGAKLKPADPAEAAGFAITLGRVWSRAVPLDYLASNLAYLLGRPVIDKTGLSGKYDYTATYTPDPGQAAVGPSAPTDAPPADGPSIFTALREQLGLRLESAKGPVEVLVIDRAEKPAAN